MMMIPIQGILDSIVFNKNFLQVEKKSEDESITTVLEEASYSVMLDSR
jgi:hypothetical protein